MKEGSKTAAQLAGIIPGHMLSGESQSRTRSSSQAARPCKAVQAFKGSS